MVDDNAPTRELVQRALEEDDMVVVTAARVSTGLRQAIEGGFDVIVLDLMLPDGDGLDLCRDLRVAGDTTPVLCLTARGEVSDRVVGLDAGADDYLRKPFAIAELRARVRALSRRGQHAVPLRIEAGGLCVDFGARRFRKEGADVPLTAREWMVLEALATRIRRLVPRAELLEEIWHDCGDAASESLDVIISRLRRKLGEGAVAIQTVRGEGYRLEVVS